MYYSEQDIINYSKPLSVSEKEQCESTINGFENILRRYGFSVTRKNYEEYDIENLDHRFHVKKENLEFTIFLQGSYGNGTCVRRDSDVDIAMICESTFTCSYPDGKSGKDYGHIDSDFNILEFKKNFCRFINSLDESYVSENHNKCIFLQGNNSSRKDMDIVPSLRHKDYKKNSWSSINSVNGVCIISEDGKRIINYPEQSRINNISKNKATSFNYKKIVRILKNIKNDMFDKDFNGIDSVSSYGLECLIYNVPDYLFNSFNGYYSLKTVSKNVISYLCANTERFSSFYETNGILKIFDNENNKISDYKTLVLKIKNILEF